MQGNSELLRHLLSRGASVHIRNRENHTPLYVAADAGYPENVKLLREAGAHLHPDEVELAEMLKQKAVRSATSSMSNSPVGGSSANSITNGNVKSPAGALMVPEEKHGHGVHSHTSSTTPAGAGATAHADPGGGGGDDGGGGGGHAVPVPTIGSVNGEAVDCWTLAGV
ncbi:hypothetical protein Dda_3068 [Drechslerella dactyloides]|uniref:Ankyrin repeat protein n=1 Tax=Drechslerella dactyloides TaxID=74499 RepID=A0AAD6J1V6_DREDA|nr:hypothetical protein Dda_3068 [Drechslerella dactyloides]